MQKESEKNELLARILANSSQAVVVLDAQGIIKLANDRSLEFLAQGNSDCVGDPFGTLVNDQGGGLLADLRNLAGAAGGCCEVDQLLTLSGGRVLNVRVRAVISGTDLILYIDDNADIDWLRRQLQMTTEQMERNLLVAREKESYLRSIFRSSGIGIALLNLNGSIVECNAVYQQLTGRTVDQLRMKSFAAYLHPEDMRGATGIFNDLAAGKCAHYQIEQRQMLPGDEDYAWVKVSASLIRSVSGRPDYALFIVEDISEQKKAELSFHQSELKYRALFEGMLDGFACHKAVRNAAGEIERYEFTEVNDACADILKLNREQVIGKSLVEVAALTDFTLEWDKLYHKVDQCRIHIRHDIYSYNQGRWYSVLAYSPQPDYFVTYIEDITERRQIEEEIRVFATELECSNRELEHFVTRASGELSGRLEQIATTITELNEDQQVAQSQQAARSLSAIVGHCDSLQGMLDGLLVYSRMVYRGNPLENVDLNDIMMTVRTILASRLAQGDLVLQWGNMPVVFADRQQIEMMFVKIIEALDLFALSEVLQVQISAVQSGKYWNINLAASPVDMPQKLLRIIFDVFRSFEYRDKTYSTGIHLPLCKKIMERHEGQIAVALAESDKCVFHLTFPIPSVE
ncbi:MAG: PAS domain S-box protein [Sedimentisphaerales bacterium]|nr:PAS domain S-box protein [Sedimentisphaerales bacterium]MBN2842226.1 PAS domain S-box protein [Sedimentisphaerales bacterium]